MRIDLNLEYQHTYTRWIRGKKVPAGVLQVKAKAMLPNGAPLSAIHIEADIKQVLWNGFDVTELLESIGYSEDDIIESACEQAYEKLMQSFCQPQLSDYEG